LSGLQRTQFVVEKGDPCEAFKPPHTRGPPKTNCSLLCTRSPVRSVIPQPSFGIRNRPVGGELSPLSADALTSSLPSIFPAFLRGTPTTQRDAATRRRGHARGA